MRVDNQIYFAPAAPGRISETKFFLYPGGPTFPGRQLVITTASDIAPPADNAVLLALPGILPEEPTAWDGDEDGIPDFDDAVIDDDLVPGNIANPNPAEINANDDMLTIALTNEGLNTFTYDLDLTTLPSWIVGIDAEDAIMPVEGELTRGESVDFQIYIDCTGLDELGFERTTLILNTDRPQGAEDIEITLIVDDLDCL